MVNEDEATRVRAIFELYLEHGSLANTVRELDRRAWTNKRWVTRKGHEAGGYPFNKPGLGNLLTNVLYTGRITYKDEVHDGEHPAIVDEAVFRRAQQLLRQNWVTAGRDVRNRFGALLKGLLHCTPCGCAMVHTMTVKNGTRRYRYYTCTNAQKRGWHNCPSKSIPAREIESFVVDQIRGIGKDPGLLADTLEETRAQAKARIKDLEVEKRTLERDLGRHNAELRKLAGKVATNGTATDRLADLQDRIRAIEQRATQVREELITLGRELVDEKEVARALAVFDPVWESLAPREQVRVIRLLVQRVDYDGARKTVSVTFHPAGIKMLSRETGSA
jgi:site-specific DNA recombinase